jgi:putative ABC transport system permease protein
MNNDGVRDELEFHIEQLTEEHMRAGMSREDARRAALAQFGAINTIEEQCRENRRGAAIESFLADARIGLRLVRRNPSFAFTVIATLAVAVAACATMFGVVDAVLLRPMGFPRPERLLAIYETWTNGAQRGAFSVPNFLDVQSQSRTLESAAAYHFTSWNVAGRETEALSGVSATSDFFRVLGVQPAYGRSFARDERGVAVISYGLAQRRFGSAETAVNRPLIMDGKARTVVGVMPRGFRFPDDDVSIWTPLNFGPDDTTQRGAHYLRVIGRVRPSANEEQASRELDLIGTRLAQTYPDTNEGETYTATRLDVATVLAVRRGLLILLAAVLVLAMIAAANLGNLLLTRAAGRAREWSVRSALGASRFRMARQFLTESFVLGAIGGACAVALTSIGLRLVVRFGPEDIPRLGDASLNARVLLLTIGASLVMSVLFGIVPSIAAAREGRVAGSPAATRFRSAMTVAQLALAVTLLCGAALLIRSFQRVLSVAPGFDPRHVVAFDISLPSTYDGTARVNTFHDALLDRLRRTPGVASAGAISQIPLGGGRFSSSFKINGVERDEWHAAVYVADEGYFRAMRVPIVRGRGFDGSERAGGDRVLLVSETAAKRFWPDRDPIGIALEFGASGGYERYKGRIIGVVADVHQQGQEEDVEPTFYVPLRQAGLDFATYVVRAEGDPATILGAMRPQVRAVDPNIAVGHLTTMQEQLADSVARRRFQLFLLSFFAGAALLLASLGVYGVIGYSVSQRTREIGIRVALGSSVAGVFRMILGEALRLVAPALALGLAVALLSRRVIAALLFGVSATDVSTLASVAMVVALVSLIAACIPARRAAAIDPTIAMRYD